jgi:hypothetical protein
MLQISRHLARLLALTLIAFPLALPMPALADLTTVMVLNVGVDISGVTGDNGNFTVVCHVSEHGKVKQNFLDGHTQTQLLHDNVNGTYVARYQGSVRVEMNRQFGSPQYDFAKLDTYYCNIAMLADGMTSQPSITGSLPKTPATLLRDGVVKPRLLVPAMP